MILGKKVESAVTAPRWNIWMFPFSLFVEEQVGLID
jgi:hypothetical protein